MEKLKVKYADLDNADNLDNIKWIFNGTKNPADFNQNLLNAIDGLPLTEDLAQKFGQPDINGLKDLINSKFSDIFKLTE